MKYTCKFLAPAIKYLSHSLCTHSSFSMSVEEVEKVLLYSLEYSVSADEQKRTEVIKLKFNIIYFSM